MKAFLLLLLSVCTFNVYAMQQDDDDAQQELLIQAAREFLRLHDASVRAGQTGDDIVPGEAMQALQEVGLDATEALVLLFALSDPDVRAALRDAQAEPAEPSNQG